MLADRAPASACAGLLQVLPGLGPRALRYSMLLDDGKVVAVNVDEPGPKVGRAAGSGHR
jgi:peroxiredoxin